MIVSVVAMAGEGGAGGEGEQKISILVLGFSCCRNLANNVYVQ